MAVFFDKGVDNTPENSANHQQRPRSQSQGHHLPCAPAPGPTGLGVLPSPPGQVLAHLSLSSYSSLPQSLKSSAAMGTALASGRLGVGEGTQSVGLLRPQAQREEEVTKSGFQWMPETTLKRVLRHCECSPASLCPPTAELGDTEPRTAQHPDPAISTPDPRGAITKPQDKFTSPWDSTHKNN